MPAERKGLLNGVLGYMDECLVSNDFDQDPHSPTFHMDQSKVLGRRMCRVPSWYDSEWGFSNPICDTAVAMGALL